LADKPNPLLYHFLVPKHEVLSKTDADSLVKKLGVSSDQLPQILLSDPIVEALDAEKGSIIKIVRKSFTADQSVYYRVVV
jgi:DNA-directed RNA polymerase subunit H